jgi:hypothetical protein
MWPPSWYAVAFGHAGIVGIRFAQAGVVLAVSSAIAAQIGPRRRGRALQPHSIIEAAIVVYVEAAPPMYETADSFHKAVCPV